MVKTDLFKYHFIPATEPSDKLMIVLHGKGDTLNPFKNFPEELKVKNINYLLLNAPKRFLRGYSWYGDPPYIKHGVQRSRKLLLKLIEELELQGWNTKNIVILGFSQGCLMGTDLILNSQKRFAGMIGVSGYFYFFPRWKKMKEHVLETPCLFTHGKKDDVLPLEVTKYGVSKLQSAGFKVDWVEFDKKHVFTDDDNKEIKNWLQEKLF